MLLLQQSEPNNIISNLNIHPFISSLDMLYRYTNRVQLIEEYLLFTTRLT